MELTTFNTKEFGYTKETKTLYAFITDVMGPVMSVPREFLLKSEHTGKVIKFKLMYKRVEDGDVLEYYYNNEENDVKVKFFND